MPVVKSLGRTFPQLLAKAISLFSTLSSLTFNFLLTTHGNLRMHKGEKNQTPRDEGLKLPPFQGSKVSLFPSFITSEITIFSFN